MLKQTSLLFAAALIALPISPANAGERYSTPPPIVLSPDLTSPWIMQLRNAPEPRQKTQQRTRTVKRTQQRYSSQTQRHHRRSGEATGIFSGFKKRESQQVRVQRRKKKVAYNRVQTPRSGTVDSATYIRQQQAQRPIDPKFLPRTISYQTKQKPGTILIDTSTRYLYLVLGNGKARRYGVGVGKQGFSWSGTERITRKAQWPSWRPPAQMIARERKKGRELPAFMPGGPENPMGARALYLGSTLYRIHGTNQPWTIGQAVSSGCIRMRNEDVMDLYERARKGAKVIVS